MTSTTAASDQPSRCSLASALLAAATALRIAYAFCMRVDSDETQHLHVAWAWTRGLLQYRDVFDNHMPLFHLLTAPLLAAAGERPAVLFLARLAMIPPWGLAVWATARLGRRLFSRATGTVAAVATALLPAFFFCSVEFRPDTLWTALWLLALVVLVEGRIRPARAFGAGLLLGSAVAVSMKSVLLLGALGLAATGSMVVTPGPVRPPLRRLAVLSAVMLLGVVLPVTPLAGFFAAEGAWRPFVFATVFYNLVPGYSQRALGGLALFPLVLAVLAVAARAVARRASTPAVGARRAFILLAAGTYLATLVAFCPLPVLAREHFLPLYPLLVVLLAPAALAVAPPRVTIAAVAAVELTMLLGARDLRSPRAHEATDLLSDVLRLTNPDEPVMDLKGETVFRPRAWYWVLEPVLQARLAAGMVQDDVRERLIATRTCVAVGDDYHFPPRARAFLRDSYVPVGRLRVAGRRLSVPPGAAAVRFELGISARYAVVSRETGVARGALDGIPYAGARWLDAGWHEYRTAPGEDLVAVLWAPALERGFSPFADWSVEKGSGGRRAKP